MSSEEFEFRKELKEWFTGAKKVVLAGIGNPIRMDDIVGLRVIRLLQGKVSKSILLIECETVPESFMQQIIDFNPTHILLIDAAILELHPGDSRMVKPASLKDSHTVSTHMLPLRIFCDYIGEATNAKIGLLLIQPRNTDFGEGLSPEVEESAKKIAKELTRNFPEPWTQV